VRKTRRDEERPRPYSIMLSYSVFAKVSLECSSNCPMEFQIFTESLTAVKRAIPSPPPRVQGGELFHWVGSCSILDQRNAVRSV